MTVAHYYSSDFYKMHLTYLNLHRISKGPSQKILCSWLDRMKIIAKIQLITYCSAVVGIFLCPLTLFFFYHKKFLILTMRLPFVDIETTSGFVLTSIFEGILFNVMVMISYGVDLIFVVNCFMGAAYIDLCRIDCDRLGIEIENVIAANYDSTIPALLRYTVLRNKDMTKLIYYTIYLNW